MDPDRDQDILADEADRIASALFLIERQLRLLGQNGAEALSMLMSSRRSLEAEEGPRSASRDTFRAFHLGFKTEQDTGPNTGDDPPVWSSNHALNDAYKAGWKAAQLNLIARKPPWYSQRPRTGPFDVPEAKSAFAAAMRAVTTSGKRLSADR